MVNLKINGNTVSVEEGTTILEAARRRGSGSQPCVSEGY